MKAKKVNYNVGDEIIIDEKTDKVIDIYAKRTWGLKFGMAEMATMANKSNELLFEAIHERYPELKDYRFSVDTEKNIIRISHKRI